MRPAHDPKWTLPPAAKLSARTLRIGAVAAAAYWAKVEIEHFHDQ
jgi:hypothetical protein